MQRHPSILRNLLISFLLFGTGVGFIFPFYAEFFVTWKPGMYPWFFVGCIIAGAVIGVVNYILVKTLLLKKLQRIAEIAQAISNKDISHQCNIVSHDIIGDIVNSFNHMTENLRNMITHISADSNQLHDASKLLTDLTQQATTDSLSQQSQVEQAATAMNQLAATAQEVARNAAQAASATNDANVQSDSAKVVVVESMSAVDRLADMVKHSTTVIAKLENESDNIGNVLSVINSIADQTNLLALNAAIEAARAGEHGRGFAVVADEVRTLANRTQDSTEEISAIIERLQSGSRDAVSSMDEGQTQAQKGVELTEQAAEALATIAGHISIVSEMSSQIANASNEQNIVVEEVNKTMVEINDVSTRTKESMLQIDEASLEVTHKAENLQDLISGFKLVA